MKSMLVILRLDPPIKSEDGIQCLMIETGFPLATPAHNRGGRLCGNDRQTDIVYGQTLMEMI